MTFTREAVLYWQQNIYPPHHLKYWPSVLCSLIKSSFLFLTLLAYLLCNFTPFKKHSLQTSLSNARSFETLKMNISSESVRSMCAQSDCVNSIINNESVVFYMDITRVLYRCQYSEVKIWCLASKLTIWGS